MAIKEGPINQASTCNNGENVGGYKSVFVYEQGMAIQKSMEKGNFDSLSISDENFPKSLEEITTFLCDKSKHPLEHEFAVMLYLRQNTKLADVIPEPIKIVSEGDEYNLVIRFVDALKIEDIEELDNDSEVLVEMFSDLSKLLEEMRKMGIYHHDLHGGNIFYDLSKRRIYIIDFGEALSESQREHLMRTVKYPVIDQLQFYDLFIRVLAVKDFRYYDEIYTVNYDDNFIKLWLDLYGLWKGRQIMLNT